MSTGDANGQIQGPFFRAGNDQEGKNLRRLQRWQKEGKAVFEQNGDEFKIQLSDNSFLNIAKDKLLAHDYNRGGQRGRGRSNNSNFNASFNANGGNNFNSGFINKNQGHNGQGNNQKSNPSGW